MRHPRTVPVARSAGVVLTQCGVLPPKPPASTGWSYLPALDGLRAVAVVAVVLFHYLPDQFGGGFVGVDVFFVLSGYLITGMILDEIDRSGRLDLRAFWGRRIRRLVPAVLVLVAACAVAVFVTGTGSARGLMDSIGALTWTTNWLELGFRDAPWLVNDPRTVLDHLWSLAIEEQFYVMWPPLLWWMRRRGLRGGSLLAAIGLLSAASVASMWASGPIIGYFRTDARAFELLGGAALAVSGVRPTRRWSGVLVALGAAALILYVPLGDPEAAWMYPWGFLGLTVAFVALVAGVVDPPAVVGAVLTQPLVRHIGRVSFGIYLWHIPVLRLLSGARVGFDGPALYLLRLVVLAALVEASYRMIEGPIRIGRVPFGRRQVALSYGAVSLCLLLYVPGVRSSLDHQWDVVEEPPETTSEQVRVMATGDLLGTMVGAGLARDDGLGVYEAADLDCYFVEYGTVMDGDEDLDNDRRCSEWERRWTHAAEDFAPDVAVYSSGYWDTLERRVDGTPLESGDAELTRRYAAVASAQLDLLDRLAPEVVVVIVDDVSPMSPTGQRDPAARRADLDAWNSALRDASAARDGVTVVDVRGVESAADIVREAERQVAERVLAAADRE